MQYNFNFLNLEYIWRAIIDFLKNLGFDPSFISVFIVSVLDFLRPYSLILSGLFLIGLVYAIIRTDQIVAEESEKLDLAYYKYKAKEAMGNGRPINTRWQKVVEHISSSNSSDWRLAIMEADIMLDEMLDSMGYHGESIGAKLKQIEPSDFTTLDGAWEAHKIRNQIAHDGAVFELTDREAKRVITLYEQVFNEFKYI